MLHCPQCGREYNAAVLTKCPKCHLKASAVPKTQNPNAPPPIERDVRDTASEGRASDTRFKEEVLRALDKQNEHLRLIQISIAILTILMIAIPIIVALILTEQ